MGSTIKKIVSIILCLTQPSWATWSVIDHSGGQTNTCTGGADVSLTINSTNATLLVADTVTNDAATAPTDSVGACSSPCNTWTLAKNNNLGFTGHSLYYVKNPTVGASHNIKLSNANRCAGITVTAFTCADTTAPLDATDQANGGCTGTTCQAITGVGANGELVVSAIATDWTGTASIDNTFSITDQFPFVSGTAYGTAMAWKSVSGSINPTWTYGSGGGVTGLLTASFKAGSCGGAAAGGASKMQKLQAMDE